MSDWPACKCNKCGKVEVYHRLGCSCTPSFEDEQDMIYGQLDDDGNFVPFPETTKPPKGESDE